MSAARQLSLLVALTGWGIGCTPPAAPPETPDTPPTTEKEQPKPADPRYRALPQPTEALDFSPPQVHRESQVNGLAVWTMQRESAPLVSIQLLLPTGAAQDPRGKEGLSLLAADLLDEGAGKLNALQLSDELGRLATDYTATVGLDYTLLTMSSLTENLEPSLRLLADIVLRPRLSAEEFQRRRDHHVARALADQDSPRHARSRGFAHALFGDGYAGRPSEGTPGSLRAVQLWEVRQRVRTMAVAEGAHLAVAGTFDAQKLQSLVAEVFGKWKGERSRFEPVLEDEPEGMVAYVVDFPGAAQSSLVVGRRAGQNGDAAYFAEEVLNQRLGGSFISRINMNLREDKGYTYGAQSVFARYDYAGSFGVYTDVVTEATAASVQEIFQELEAVCDARPLTAMERDEAVRGMVLGFAMDFEETSALGNRLVSLPLRSRPTDYWATWQDQVSAISTEQANEAAQPYCDRQRLSVVVAGDVASFGSQLEELGLSLVHLDADGSPVERDDSSERVGSASP